MSQRKSRRGAVKPHDKSQDIAPFAFALLPFPYVKWMVESEGYSPESILKGSQYMISSDSYRWLKERASAHPIKESHGTQE